MSVAGERERPVQGVVNMAAGLVILLIIIPLALRTPQPPPPQIAEFAPQTKQITAPDVNSKVGPVTGGGTIPGGKGNGPGVGPGAGGAPTPTPGKVVNYGSTLCIGSPARQIEDPQSPPCVTGWTGNNGGATAPGVTGSTIKVAIPEYDPKADPAFAAFFNQRFELYGRTLVPVQVTSGACDPSQQQGQAVAAQTPPVFATLSYSSCSGWDYYNEMARDHVMVMTVSSQFTQTDMRALSPYVWAYPMAQDGMFRTLGAWACDRLVGRPALHAGDPTLRATTRKFGIILDHQSPNNAPDPTLLANVIEACGAPKPYVYTFYANGVDQTNEEAIQGMKAQGVTSIFCLCAFGTDVVYANAASNQAYFPEWLTTSYLTHEDQASELQLWPAAQRADVFGITFEPREVKWADNPVLWALAGGDPSGGWNAGGQPPTSGYTTNGTPPSSSTESEASLDDEYRVWLMLASGIQMAGPDLTAATFQAALQRTAFPNPETPINAGHVGFAGRSNSMTVDAAEFWWNNSAANPTTAYGPGAVCYVQGGARRTSWPSSGDPFFQPTCDSGGYAGQP